MVKNVYFISFLCAKHSGFIGKKRKQKIQYNKIVDIEIIKRNDHNIYVCACAVCSHIKDHYRGLALLQ